MANEFKIKNGLLVESGDSQITGSLTAPNITGSLFGTASWARNAVTASFVTASNVNGPFGSNSIVSSSYALTASYALNAGGASAITVADEGTAQGTATFLNFTGAGVTATVSSNTASIDIPGGAGSTFPFTGSAIISGSLQVTGSVSSTGGFTGSLLGTSSWAQNSVTASYVQQAVSSSFSTTASYAVNYNSSSLLTTASAAGSTITFTKGDGSTFNVTITTGGTVETASYVLSSGVDGPLGMNSILSASNARTASYVLQAVSSSFATTASYALQAVSASYSQTASYGINIIISGSVSNADYIQFNTTANVTDAVGRLYYNSGEGTLNVGLAGGNVVANIGEDLYQYAYNATGAPLTKGQVVYISGSQGNRIAVKLASATAEQGSANTLGLVAEPIGTGGEGWIQTEGVLRKLNTTGLVGGQLIYLSSSAGQYTQTKPVAPLHEVRLGYAERIDNTVGSIYIKIDNGYEIDELHNVLDTSTTGSYGDLFVKSGSLWINSKQLTGSYGLTGSLTTVGSIVLTGSLNITGSTLQVGNNTLLGNTTLSGSIIISGSTASTPSIKIYGDTQHNGYIRFDPVTTNIDSSITASYIYVSGSTNDLYFTQNGQGYANTTRLRWLEGNLYTGLLNGGIISASIGSNTYTISSGSGIIVNLNASYNDNPYPTVQYLNWGNLNGTIDALSASYDQSFVAVLSNSTIGAQGTPYNDGDYNTKIPIGIVIHQNRSTINAFQTFPSVAYGWKQRSYDFIRAFGPLKISGYTLSPSGSSTGSLVLSGGTAWVDGRNYTVDPSNPSYITEGTGITTSKIYRYYQSGSGWVYDTNAGAGYTTIDPANYSLNGVLTPVDTNKWTIQRVYYFPNSATKAFYIYYGNAEYANETEALAAVSTEPFNEAPNTAANAIYVGFMLLRYNANFTVPASYEFYSAGLFRGSGAGGAGGGGGATALTQLTDVSITSPTDYQPFAYNSVTTKWENRSTISASLKGNADTATTASYALTASSADAFTVRNFIELKPGTDPGTANISASYLFVTASGDNTEFNLHYRNNGALWETHWLEQVTNTGLVWGGVLTFTASLTDTPPNTTQLRITPGAGLLINHNANTGSHGDTVPTYVEFGPITASAEFITSSQVTYLLIDENGQLIQQTTQFTPEQYTEKFPLGYIFCLTTSSISSYADARVTTYGQVEQEGQFVRAFGPLKLSGYDITPQTGSLKISIAAGQSFRYGGFYTQNPNSPSVYDSNNVPTGSLVRVYRDPGVTGGFRAQTNAGLPFTNIDPTKWDDGSGTLQTVGADEWTIQRIFQGVVNGISYVYYGQNVYGSLSLALQSITTDQFVESPTSILALPFIGYIIAKGNTTDLGDETNNRIIQAGLFRNTAGSSGGGGAAAQSLNDLSDVTITGPVNGQALVYSSGFWVNGDPTTAQTASYVLQAVSASFATNALTASYVLNAVSSSFASTASYVLNAISSSFASTASFVTLAQTASFVTTAQTASYVQQAQSASYVLQAVSASFATTASYYQLVTGSAGTDFNIVPTASGSIINIPDASSTARGLITTSSQTIFGSKTFSRGGLVVNDNDSSNTTGVNFTIPSNLSPAGTSNTKYTGILGASTTYIRLGLGGGKFINSVSNQDNYLGVVISSTSPSTTGNSTGSLFASLAVRSLTGTAITHVTHSATVYIEGASTFASSRGDYALWVDSGSVRFDGDLIMSQSNVIVTGSVNATAGFTGSLLGTASWAQNATTASFITGSNVYGPYGSNSILSASYAVTAAYALNAGAGTSIIIADEGTAQGTATFLNFIGDGVTATVSSNTASINIPGGAGSTFPYTGSAIISGSLQVTGSVSVVNGGFTGSLLGTASWAENAITASYVTLAQTASYIVTAQSASFVTASNVYGPYGSNSILSASFAVSASWAPGGNVQVFPYTGSAIISGSLIVTGSVSVIDGGFTGSLLGTASWANNAQTASYVQLAQSASYVTGSIFTSTNPALSASYALSSSYSVTASYAANGGVTSFNTRLGAVTLQETDISGLGAGIVSSSTFTSPSQGTLRATINGVQSDVDLGVQATDNVQFAQVTASFTGSLTGALIGTASWANNATNATTAATASSVGRLTQDVIITGSLVVSGSALTELFVLGDQQITGSLRVTNGVIAQTITGSFTGSLTGTLIGTASWATNAVTASYVTGSIFTSANRALSASYAVTASFALNAGAGGLETKAGSVANTSFAGNPRKATVTFATSFANTSYAIVVTGEDARSWTIESKAVGSFVINANSNTGLSGTTYWIATAYGET